MKISCLNPIAAVGMQLFTDAYEKVDDFAASDAALVRSASVHELELPDQLLAIARAGAGVNNIPLDKCAEKGIVVFNTPGANANGVKEAVLAGLFLGCKRHCRRRKLGSDSKRRSECGQTCRKRQETVCRYRDYGKEDRRDRSGCHWCSGSQCLCGTWYESLWL